MPDERPNAPAPASGAVRLSLGVEPMRTGAEGSYIDDPKICFADDDGAQQSG